MIINNVLLRYVNNVLLRDVDNVRLRDETKINVILSIIGNMRVNILSIFSNRRHAVLHLVFYAKVQNVAGPEQGALCSEAFDKDASVLRCE